MDSVVGRQLGAAGLGGKAGSYHDDLEWEAAWRIFVMMIAFLLFTTIVEESMHSMHHWLEHRNHRGYTLAFDKVKDELTILGVIGLVLSAVEDDVVKICVPWLNDMHSLGVPCSQRPGVNSSSHLELLRQGLAAASANASSSGYGYGGRRLGGETSADVLGSSGTLALCTAKGMDQFISLHSIHQIHILIFLIAITHICFSVLVAAISFNRISHWSAWEHWGDDPGETIDKLRAPRDYDTSSLAYFPVHFVQQFTHTVDPYSYLAMRRFYVLRNRLEHEFPFEKLLQEMLNEDLGSVLGISWWMWLIVGVEFIMEGYGAGAAYFQLLLSIAISLMVGAAMMYVSTGLVTDVSRIFAAEAHGGGAGKKGQNGSRKPERTLTAHDDEESGMVAGTATTESKDESKGGGAPSNGKANEVSAAVTTTSSSSSSSSKSSAPVSDNGWFVRRVQDKELESLQMPRHGKDGKMLDPVRVSKLTGHAGWMLMPVRAVLFACSVIAAQTIFYVWQIGGHACYFDSRGSGLYVVLCLCLFLVLHMGMVTIPLYAVAATSGHHQYREEMKTRAAAVRTQRLVRGFLQRKHINMSHKTLVMQEHVTGKSPDAHDGHGAHDRHFRGLQRMESSRKVKERKGVHASVLLDASATLGKNIVKSKSKGEPVPVGRFDSHGGLGVFMNSHIARTKSGKLAHSSIDEVIHNFKYLSDAELEQVVR